MNKEIAKSTHPAAVPSSRIAAARASERPQPAMIRAGKVNGLAVAGMAAAARSTSRTNASVNAAIKPAAMNATPKTQGLRYGRGDVR